MKVILLKDVKNQGKKDDVIEVSDGYAINFLIKKGLAVKYTEKSKELLEKEMLIKEKEVAKELKEAKEYKKILEKDSFVIKMKSGVEGKLFGTVSTKQIANLIKEKLELNIDKKQIKIISPIDTLGTHKVIINLHKEVEANIKIDVKEE